MQRLSALTDGVGISTTSSFGKEYCFPLLIIVIKIFSSEWLILMRESFCAMIILWSSSSHIVVMAVFRILKSITNSFSIDPSTFTLTAYVWPVSYTHLTLPTKRIV